MVLSLRSCAAVNAARRGRRSLTYLGVAEGVLRMPRGARTALRQLVNVQAAEDEQQADEVLVHGLHFPPNFDSPLCLS